MFIHAKILKNFIHSNISLKKTIFTNECVPDVMGLVNMILNR